MTTQNRPLRAALGRPGPVRSEGRSVRTTLRRLLPGGLGSLAGLACLLCCLVPFLIAAGILGGAAWSVFGTVLPGIAVALAGLSLAAWWWSSRRRAHAAGCQGSDCSCSQPRLVRPRRLTPPERLR